MYQQKGNLVEKRSSLEFELASRDVTRRGTICFHFIPKIVMYKIQEQSMTRTKLVFVLHLGIPFLYHPVFEGREAAFETVILFGFASFYSLAHAIKMESWMLLRCFEAENFPHQPF